MSKKNIRNRVMFSHTSTTCIILASLLIDEIISITLNLPFLLFLDVCIVLQGDENEDGEVCMITTLLTLSQMHAVAGVLT